MTDAPEDRGGTREATHLTLFLGLITSDAVSLFLDRVLLK
jgi:hypothetical protein